jgi:glycosyltransferase involved in cell wall biosynthesis
MADTDPATSLRPWSPEWYERQKSALGEAACRALGFYVIPPELRLSVVIPVYNEEKTLRSLIDRVRNVPVRKEIVLIDDCSKDRSRDVLKELEAEGGQDDFNRIRIFFHDVNRGKGAALRTGFAQVQGDIVIIQDADLEYNPDEYPRLLQPLIEDKADVVYGSRFLGDKAHRVLYYWHYLGNKFLTTLSNCFTNLNLTDMETCYKVFRRSVIDEITPKLVQNRFGFEPEITARVARRRLRVYEISVSYSGRTYAEGKKIGWRDGFKALWCIVRFGLAD